VISTYASLGRARKLGSQNIIRCYSLKYHQNPQKKENKDPDVAGKVAAAGLAQKTNISG